MERSRTNILSRAGETIVDLAVPFLLICLIAAATFAICYYVRKFWI